ncbi:toprim domain-containing protein [Fibrella sp. HMF5335]|uniref:Toprim domain-containing protein n=1 Tax=Fibrella rubiginis TaxID=2817060 RepID=A0A939GJ13_9BACT|nr:toprim domain-containing protein [Fibrella rubiginis]MBO0939211.1 toprim domain-containing protein [Fibrella rubiginis]
MKQKAQNRATREQLAILRHLNKAGVRYLAFGDYAMNAIDPARAIGNVQLWIEPTRANFERLDTAIQAMYGPRVLTRTNPDLTDNPQPKKMLTLGDGPQRVGLYPAINGFQANDFGDLFTRAQTNRAALITNRGKLDGSVAYRQLAVPDLYQNVRESTAYHKAWNVQTLEKYADDRRIDLSPNGTQRTASTGMKEETEVSKATKPNQPTDAKTTEGDTTTKPRTEKLVRDFEAIKRDLDLEVVLQDYGFQLDTKKSKPSDEWLIYERGEKNAKERLAVYTGDKYGQKMFVDMNDQRGWRGDVIKFLERVENGIYRNVFKAVDRIMASADYTLQKTVTAPLKQVKDALIDTKLREKDLHSRYTIAPLTDTRYLEGRSLHNDVLFSPEFDGRIKNISYTSDKGATYHNTAFPMYAQDGHLVSMDIRNERFKSFPSGERGEAMWHSNRFYELTMPLAMHGRNDLPVGTIGTVHRPRADTISFDFVEEGVARQVQLPIESARNAFKEVQAQRILVAESAIDALSFKQLNPEAEGERRFYMATGGQPGSRQMGFIQKVLDRNPEAQFVIAQDGDNAGLRFAINYLGLTHPAADPALRVKPEIAYSGPNLPPNPLANVLGPKFAFDPEVKTFSDVLKRFDVADGTLSEGHKLAINHQARFKEIMPNDYVKVSVEMVQSVIPAFTYAKAFGVPLPNDISKLAQSEYMTGKVGNEFRFARERAMISGNEFDNRLQLHKDAKLEKDLYSGVNKLDLELRQPLTPGTTGPGEAQQRNEAFLGRFLDEMNRFTKQFHYNGDANDKENKVQEFQRETLLDSQQNQAVTRTRIHFPNDGRLLVKALTMLSDEINQRQGQALYQVVRPTRQQKDLNDVLQNRQGEPLPDSSPLKVGAPPTIRPHTELKSEQTAKQTTAEPAAEAVRAYRTTL